jgi:DNA repair protein RadC
MLKTYQDDLEDYFIDECIHFSEYLKSLNKHNLSLHALYLLIKEKNIQSVYPNIEIVLRIFLSTPASNCSAERSFTSLRRIKNYLRSTLSDEKLNAFAILAIENKMLENISFEEIFEDFIKVKLRRNV